MIGVRSLGCGVWGARRAAFAVVVVFFLLPFSFSVCHAAPPTVSQVAKELVCDCPDCGRQALDQCPNCEKGREYRALIAERLKQGQSKEQIINYFADTYGEHMLGNPRPRGFGQAAFALPALAVVLGIVPLALALRSRRRAGREVRDGAARKTTSRKAESSKGRAAPSSSAAPALTAADDARVAAALRDYDFW